jgi:hypothetical protein
MNAITGAWALAKAAFDQAKAAEDAYDRDTWTAAHTAVGNKFDEPLSALMPIDSAIEFEMERLVDIRCEAEEALIVCASPTLGDTIWKIEYARVRWDDQGNWPAKWWSAVMRDLNAFAMMPHCLEGGHDR